MKGDQPSFVRFVYVCTEFYERFDDVWRAAIVDGNEHRSLSCYVEAIHVRSPSAAVSCLQQGPDDRSVTRHRSIVERRPPLAIDVVDGSHVRQQQLHHLQGTRAVLGPHEGCPVVGLTLIRIRSLIQQEGHEKAIAVESSTFESHGEVHTAHGAVCGLVSVIQHRANPLVFIVPQAFCESRMTGVISHFSRRASLRGNQGIGRCVYENVH
mmetsp:Transcript_51806/g.130075  ORF Transcript_51806/g.130075 Transcript_51806/m.130075 type:complete len:210 (-) Transcript_51806:892-1521(-)